MDGLIKSDNECDNNYDKSYNDDLVDSINDLSVISGLLNSCSENQSINDLNKRLKENSISDKTFSTFFQNIDGNKSNFNDFAVTVYQSSHKFSVIGIAETNVDPANKDLYMLDDYTSYYQDVDPNKSKGTGVALYVHNSINATINKKLSQSSSNLESLFVTIQNGSQTLTVGAVYSPPSRDIDEFIVELGQMLGKCPTRNTYIMGDFNIDLHKLDSQKDRAFEDVVISNGLFPLISLCTHAKPDCRETCIDNILTNEVSGVIMSGTVQNSVSHHFSIFQFTNTTHASIQKEATTQFYDFSKSNTLLFVEDLENVVNNNDCPPDFSSFLSIFHEKIEKHFKLSKPKTSKRNFKVNPWITDGIITSVNKKHDLYKTWKKSVSSKNAKGDPLAYQKYNNYRRSLKHAITAAKTHYYGKQFDQYRGNPKKTWSIINELRGKKKNAIKSLFNIDNKKITDRRIIANEFNKYFVTLASKMNELMFMTGDILIEPVTSFTSFLHQTHSNSSSIFLRDCSSEEIREIIHNLENNKSSDIPIKIIKKTDHIISPILEKYINDCMAKGEFPNELKIGKITPIFKKEDPELIKNYRPVSTLPIFGKIFEKVIYERLYSFLVSQGIMNPNQFGFRKGHSTSHALNISVNHVQQALKDKNHVLGIFIDLSKAFDTIDHKILLHKLSHYGVRGNAHKLLESYLTNRKQYTAVLGSQSDTEDIIYGVPQGSVLGPLLFLVYINDLLKCTNIAIFVLFADDTNIFVTAKNRSEAVAKANIVLDSVYQYMQANKLHINMDKCCYMHFKPKSKLNNHAEFDTYTTLSINGDEIKEVDETKFLGVIIDNKLTWNAHITSLVKKLKCCTGQLNRLRESVPNQLLKDLYHTLFESHLSYGISVWGNVPSTKMTPVATSQKHCIRVLFGDRQAYLAKFETCVRARSTETQILGAEFYQKEHTKPLFNTREILTTQNLYHYHTLLETYKIIKTHTPVSLYSCFKKSTRKETLLITPHPSENFIYNGSSLWNMFRSCPEGSEIEDFLVGVSYVKIKIKQLLLRRQKQGDQEEWDESNFSIR
jgi:hypothetical protein